MISGFEFLGKTIPLYGVFFFVGIFASALAAVLIADKEIERYDVIYSAVYTMIGAIMGAKLLFIAVSWRQIVALNVPLLALLKGGFVFYGGLMGGFLGLLIYCFQFRLPFFQFCDLYAVVLPLGHGFGRIGCHFAGCCYGIEYSGPFSVVYMQTLGDTPLGVGLLPIQGIEAVCLMGLFLFLLIGYRKRHGIRGFGVFAGQYAVGYGFLRLILERFRGDAARGIWGGISTSQWISFFLIATGAFLLLRFHWRKAKEQ